MRHNVGDQVTIRPVDSDPVLWHMQRFVTVERRVDEGFMVRFGSAVPPIQGPIPGHRLLPGWTDPETGVFRRW